MFGRAITLFRLFGFEVKVDLSWLVIAALITWSLASSVFPAYLGSLSSATYWAMGVIGALGLFMSVVIHEFSHSLVARRMGVTMTGITLFLFGGVASMSDEPPNARTEFLMALAGPVASIVLAGILYGVTALGAAGGWPVPVVGVLSYLWIINLVLAAFNLVPAFPLDGGRILRSILWGYSKRLGWATRIASSIGGGFGYLLMGLGVFYFIYGNLVGGIWWFLIGLFVRSASAGSYQQMMTKQALSGHQVREFMEENPITAPYQISVEQLVEDYIYKYHFKMFPVLQGEQLVGCVTTRQVRELPRSEWSQHTVKELSIGCTTENTISPDAEAISALSQMHRTRHSRLMVVEGDHLMGIISLKDLLQFLSLKMDLEGRGT